jgi:hypothetical protein
MRAWIRVALTALLGACGEDTDFPQGCPRTTHPCEIIDVVRPAIPIDGTVTWNGKTLPWLASLGAAEGCIFEPFRYARQETGADASLAAQQWNLGNSSMVTCLVEGKTVRVSWTAQYRFDVRRASVGAVDVSRLWSMEKGVSFLGEGYLPGCKLTVVSKVGGSEPYPDLVSVDFDETIRWDALPAKGCPLAFTAQVRIDRSNIQLMQNQQCRDSCAL